MYRIGMFEVEGRRDVAAMAAAPVLVHGTAQAMAFLGRRDRPQLLRRLTTAWARLVMRVLKVEARISGMHHLPDRPAVLLPLHEGFLDPPLLMTLGRSIRFIARQELFGWSGLGQVLRDCGHLSVSLQPTLADHRRLYREAKQIIEAGHDLVVFPQGSLLGIEAAFTAGARRIAAATGAPIVPIVITGTHRVWEHPYTPRLRRGCQVDLEIMPVEPAQIDSSDWRALERRMKARAMHTTASPARRYRPEQDGWWDDYRVAIDPDFTEVAAAVSRRRSREGGDQALRVVGADEEALP